MHRETPHNLVSDFSVRIMGSSSDCSRGEHFVLVELLNQGQELGDQVDDLGDDVQIRNGGQISELHNGPFIRSATSLVT
ncbi:hypothetical protein FRC0043_02499 [Corynebacterium belfantii]|nr:hypothetical protein FRC0043_02499 [Corynebacterium belfantii]